VKCVQLSRVAEIERDGIAAESIKSGTRYLGLEHIEAGGCILSSAPVQAGELASTKFRFGPDHLLFGKLRPYLAKIALPEFEGVCSTDIVPVRPGPDLDRRYLAYFLRQPAMVDYASARSTGANLPRLSPKALGEFQIPLLPLPKQRRIAAILDQADALRRLRRKSLSCLDELGKAIFIEMFGDPVINSKALNTQKLGSLGTLDRGRSQHRPRNDPALLGGPYPLIQTGEIARSLDFIRSYSATYSEVGLRQSKMWKKGTLCITIAANIADTAILDFDACFPDSVVGFDAGSDHINFFVHSWLKLIRGEIERVAPAVAQKNINLAILRELDIIAPDADAVEAYYRRMQTVLEQRRKLEEHDATIDQAFASLQHRAFRGEL